MYNAPSQGIGNQNMNPTMNPSLIRQSSLLSSPSQQRDKGRFMPLLGEEFSRQGNKQLIYSWALTLKLEQAKKEIHSQQTSNLAEIRKRKRYKSKDDAKWMQCVYLFSDEA